MRRILTRARRLPAADDQDAGHDQHRSSQLRRRYRLVEQPPAETDGQQRAGAVLVLIGILLVSRR